MYGGFFQSVGQFCLSAVVQLLWFWLPSQANDVMNISPSIYTALIATHSKEGEWELALQVFLESGQWPKLRQRNRH